VSVLEIDISKSSTTPFTAVRPRESTSDVAAVDSVAESGPCRPDSLVGAGDHGGAGTVVCDDRGGIPARL